MAFSWCCKDLAHSLCTLEHLLLSWTVWSNSSLLSPGLDVLPWGFPLRCNLWNLLFSFLSTWLFFSISVSVDFYFHKSNCFPHLIQPFMFPGFPSGDYPYRFQSTHRFTHAPLNSLSGISSKSLYWGHDYGIGQSLLQGTFCPGFSCYLCFALRLACPSAPVH